MGRCLVAEAFEEIFTQLEPVLSADAQTIVSQFGGSFPREFEADSKRLGIPSPSREALKANTRGIRFKNTLKPRLPSSGSPVDLPAPVAKPSYYGNNDVALDSPRQMGSGSQPTVEGAVELSPTPTTSCIPADIQPQLQSNSDGPVQSVHD